MPDRSFDRLRDIVLGASRLDGAALEAYLQEACADDPDLRRAAEDLIALDARHLQRVEDLADRGIDKWLVGSENEELFGEGTAFDSYRLWEEIGRGGSSIVFRAEQTAPVVREVALKILRTRRLDPSSHERFLAEQQVLAVLEHSHVARVFDAGTTPDGQPYFTMELIRGCSITRHCEDHHCSLETKLRLFLQACWGVEHAHRKGILHRDLKPTNLLVARQGKRGVVKVIDFGIARPLERSDDQEVTLAGDMLGTPQYMSPEQARDHRLQVDVRSDVFSLGVVLHELVSGSIPYSEELQSTLSLLGAVSRGEIVPRERDMNDHALPVDLVEIVKKSLKTDPEERYESPAALARDIENFMQYRPVEARAAGRVYALGRMVRRHPLATALVGLLMVVILGATAASTLLYRRAEEEARIARVQAETAQSLAEYVQGMFVAASPTGGDRTLTMTEALDDASERALVDLSGQPIVLAKVLKTIGNVQADLDENKRAMNNWERSMEALEGQEGSEVELLRLKLTQALANVSRNIQEDYDQAEQRGLDAIAAVQASSVAPEEKNASVYRGYFRLAELAVRFERPAAVEKYVELAEGELLASEDQLSPRALQLLYVRGMGAETIGDLRRARRLLVRAFEGYRSHLRLDDTRTLVVLNRLATVEGGLGDFESALGHHRMIMARAAELTGPDHVRMALFHHGFGTTLARLGRAASAVGHFERARTILESGSPPIPTRVADGCAGVGFVSMIRGRHAESLTAYDLAIAAEDTVAQPRSYSRARYLTHRAVVQHRLGRLEEAAHDLDQAIAMIVGVEDRHHPTLAETFVARADLELDRGRVDRALRAARQSLSIFDQDYPGDQAKRLFAAHARARARYSSGEEQAARRDLLKLEAELLASATDFHFRSHAIDEAADIFAATGDTTRSRRYRARLAVLTAQVGGQGP